MYNNKFNQIIIIDIIIMVLINIVIVFNILFYESFWSISFITFGIIIIYYLVNCIFKFIVSAIRIIKNGTLKTRIYFRNILPILVSIVYLYSVIKIVFIQEYKQYLSIFGEILHFGAHFIYTVILLLIMAVSLFLFQIYWINNKIQKPIAILSNIITPITSLLVMYFFGGMTAP